MSTLCKYLLGFAIILQIIFSPMSGMFPNDFVKILIAEILFFSAGAFLVHFKRINEKVRLGIALGYSSLSLAVALFPRTLYWNPVTTFLTSNVFSQRSPWFRYAGSDEYQDVFELGFAAFFRDGGVDVAFFFLMFTEVVFFFFISILIFKSVKNSSLLHKV